MSNLLKTVATFNTSVEAHLLKNRLEEEGLQVLITDEETVNMAWHLGQAVGGIKVQVSAEDAERAARIMDQIDAEPDPPSASDPLERLSRRALFAAFAGFLVPPFQLYSLWIALPLAFSGDPLPAVVRRRAVIAVVCDIYVLFFIVFLVRTLSM